MRKTWNWHQYKLDIAGYAHKVKKNIRKKRYYKNIPYESLAINWAPYLCFICFNHCDEYDKYNCNRFYYIAYRGKKMNIDKYCGRCHGRKLRQEWPEGYLNDE